MNDLKHESHVVSRIKLLDEQRRLEYIRRSGEHIAVLTEALRFGTLPDKLLIHVTRRRKLFFKDRITVIDLGASLSNVWDSPSGPNSRIILDPNGRLWFFQNKRLVESKNYHTFDYTGSLHLEFRLSEARWILKESGL